MNSDVPLPFPRFQQTIIAFEAHEPFDNCWNHMRFYKDGSCHTCHIRLQGIKFCNLTQILIEHNRKV